MRRALLLAIALAVACGDATSPPRRPIAPASLHVVSGDDVTDTITKWLAAPLVVEVRDSAGAVLRGAIVRFDQIPTSIPQEPFSGPYDRLAFSPVDSEVPRREYITESDAQGRAAVRVKLGVWSGRAALVVSAPEGGVQDTAFFTALPGAPYAIRFDNRDTTLVTGGDLQVRMRVEDAYRNVVDDVPALSVAGTMTSVNAQGVAHAGAPGPGFVLAKLGTVVDTMRVAVVPNATIAVVEHGLFGNWSLSVMSLDGLQRQRLVTTLAAMQMPAWNPSGNEVVYYEGFNGHDGNARLFIITTAGQRRPLLANMPQPLRTAFMPRYSPDGQWIYFTGDMPCGRDPAEHWTGMQTWRVHPDGSGAERLQPNPDDCDTAAWEPDLSPNAPRVALTYAGTISLLDPVTLARTPLVAGEFPRYSPDGRAIAYINIQPGLVSPIYIVGSDGTGVRQLTPVGRLYDRFAGHSWSPDGQWIIVRGPSRLELVRVSTGEVMTLPYSGTMWQPAFRP